MDLEQASEEMQAQIIEAREKIIYSQSWVADGLQGYVFNEDGIIVEEGYCGKPAHHMGVSNPDGF